MPGRVPGVSAASGAPAGAALRRRKSSLARDCLEPLENREPFPDRVLVVVGSPCASCWGSGVCLRQGGERESFQAGGFVEGRCSDCLLAGLPV